MAPAELARNLTATLSRAGIAGAVSERDVAQPTVGGEGSGCTNLDDCKPGLVCAGQICRRYFFIGA